MNKLKQYFDSQGIKQVDICNILGKSKAQISNYLTGKVSFGKKAAREWSNAFGLSESWLLTGEGEMLLDNTPQSVVQQNNHSTTMNLNERILTFISHLEMNVAEFERNCNLSNGSVSKMGDNTRRSTLEKISKIYPSLNLNWLLTGEGSMILGEETATQQIKFGKFVHVYIGKDAKDDKYVNVDHIVYIEKFSDHIRMITLKDSGFDVYKDCEDIFRYLISLSFSH